MPDAGSWQRAFPAQRNLDQARVRQHERGRHVPHARRAVSKTGVAMPRVSGT